MQSSIASLQDSIDNQKEYKYIEKSEDYDEYKEARTSYEEIRKTDEFFNSFITQELDVQKKKIGTEAFADIVERGRLDKFMAAANNVTKKISVIMSMHEPRQVELKKKHGGASECTGKKPSKKAKVA